LAACEPAMEDRLLHLLGENRAQAVPYGSEAGIFQGAGMPSVILGPGNIAQAHQPEEFLSRAQFDACPRVLERLVAEFC
jgi:acetylornithine deacetylase